MIQLRTLGVLDLRGPDGAEVRAILAQPKRLTLLTYLALANSRRFRRRDTVAALFWPDLDQVHARGALRQALRFLRSRLGDSAIVTRGEDEIGVDPEALWCDALAFEQACSTGAAADALTLYRGDLLEGVFVADAAPELEQWLDQERARLRRLAGSAAVRQAESDASAGDTTSAVNWFRRAAELAPYDEECARGLMRALDASGDRAGSLAAFQEFAQLLARELGAAPSPETEALVEAIRARQAVVRPPPGVGVGADRDPVVPVRRVPVYGRAAAVAAGAAVLVLVGSIGFRHSQTRMLAPERVAVAIFENRTGDRSLDPLGAAAADWITRGLTQTGVLQVMDPRTMLPRGDSAAIRSVATRRGLAEATGAGTIVAGSYLRARDSLVFQAEVTDARSGRVVSVVEPVAAPVPHAMDAVEMLRQRLTARLAFLVDPKLGSWANTVNQPPSYEAYREFVEARELAEARRGAEARARMERVAAMDSSWPVPLLELAAMYDAVDDVKAESLFTILERSRARLLPLERAVLDRWQAIRRGDTPGALRASREMVRLAPRSQFEALHAMTALCDGRPREAVSAMRQLDRRVPWVRDWQSYWVVLTFALHHLGDHEGELTVAREARRVDPDLLRYLWLETRALAALGRIRDVERRLEESDGITRVLGTDPGVQWTPGILRHQIAEELRAHGHEAAALRAYASSEAWYAGRSPRERTDSNIQRLRMHRLHATGRIAEAESVATALLGVDTLDLDVRRVLGALAAMRGDRAAAERHLAWFAAFPANWFQRFEVTLARAGIAARLGDTAEAVTLVRRSFSEGCTRLYLHINTDLLPLRRVPAFQELLRPVD